MEHHYYPVKAIRYHFTEFNILVGIFIAVNGGLLVAYSNETLKCDNISKIFLSIFGFIISILFFCCSRIYNLCVIRLSDLLDIHFKKNLHFFTDYPTPLRYAKISTTYIVLIFSIILMIVWETLIVFNSYVYKGFNNTLLCIMIIAAISLTAFIFFCCFVFLKCHFNKKINENKDL